MILALKKNGNRNHGFTLLEAVTATAILAFVTSSVWVVIDRCVESTTNSKLKIQAFEVARENLESILVKEEVKEIVESGKSEKYPEIEWETLVETFFEPINSQMWLRAICTAKYYDTKDEEQTITLEHWLTGLNKDQLMKILMRQSDDIEDFKLQLIETIEDAADYAGVAPETIEEWLANGMETTDDGYFTYANLDLFKLNDGNPSKEDMKNLQISSEQDFNRMKLKQSKMDMEYEIDPTTGLTYGQMEQMDIQEIWELMKKTREGESDFNY